MRFERDETYSLSPLVDDKGRHFKEAADGYVDFGSVARNLLGQQCQYASRTIEGSLGNPTLGNDLRFNGLDNRGNYHEIGIHPEDVDEFVRRHAAWTTLVLGYAEDEEGTKYPLNDAARETLHGYLESVGAFDHLTDET